MPRADRVRRSSGPPLAPTGRAVAPWLVLASAALLSCEARGTLVVVLTDGPVDGSVFVEMLVARGPEPRSSDCADLLGLQVPYHLGDISLPGEWEVVARHGMRADRPDEAPRLGVLRAGDLVAARSRGPDCVLLGQACSRLKLSSREQQVRLVLQPPPDGAPTDCPEGFICGTDVADDDPEDQWSACVYECRTRTDCLYLYPPGRFYTPTESVECDEWRCGFSEDADDDDLPRFDDCDDYDATIPSVSGLQTCGAARDHDCDGVVDALDVCLPRALAGCTRYAIEDWASPPADAGLDGLLVRDVFVSDNRLVVLGQTGGASGDPVLWLGTLTAGGGLRRTGTLQLPDSRAQVPRRLAVLGDRAFFTLLNAVHVVDLTDPALPGSSHRGIVPGPGGLVFNDSPLLVAPPFLLATVVGGSNAAMVWDASLVEPAAGWPVMIGGLRLTAMGAGGFALRGGEVYGFGGGSRDLEHARLSLGAYTEPELLPYVRDLDRGFNVTHVDGYDTRSGNPAIRAVAVSRGGSVFVAVHDISDSATVGHYLLRLRWDGEGLAADPIGEGGEQLLWVARGEETTPTRGLYVWGDSSEDILLIRTSVDPGGTSGLLHLHSAVIPAVWTDIDLEAPVLGVAGLGDRIFLALGAGGLRTGRLVCAD